MTERAWQNKKAWKLYKENWKFCREIVSLRDGRRCRIQGCHVVDGLQLDHVFSRECKSLFFDLDNLGFLCAAHHQHKSFRRGQWVDHQVKEIARKRNPAWYDEAIVKSIGTLGSFRTVWYQEQVNIKLKEEKARTMEEV